MDDKSVIELVTSSVEDTQHIGELIGQRLHAGDVVALSGELGSGKTTLIQGIARGVGHESNRMKSPTFVLVREYPGDIPIVHVDGYRLAGAAAAAWLDLDLLFSAQKITFIEWAERFADVLPVDHLVITLAHVSTNRRRITITATGPRSAAIVAQCQEMAVSASTSESSEDNGRSRD